MSNDTNKKLVPLSWLYGLAVGIRNELFNLKILRSRQYDFPVIGIGNITVGGTGKTPHVEYIIRMIKDSCRVAVLSRGYMRKSKGYVLANDTSSMDMIGDEPYQMMQKFPEIMVAVDEKRVDGIDRLMKLEKKPDVILLDDCYQHRYVKPGIQILLVDYNRMPNDDKLLPAGRLREPISERDRADIIIVTKCPADMKPIDFRVLTKTIDAYPYQKLFFSTMEYQRLYGLFEDDNDRTLELTDELSAQNVLLLTGIACPTQMFNDIHHHVKEITPLSFSDHHNFSADDVAKINATFAMMPEPKIIVTTEKDASRLKSLTGLNEEVRRNLFVLPICVRFLNDQEDKFRKIIADYVRQNSSADIVVEKVEKPVEVVPQVEEVKQKPTTISFTEF